MADDRQQEATSVERQTIREALADYAERQREEEIRKVLEERRKARDERADARRQARVDTAKRTKAKRLRSAVEMSQRVEAHVAEARRSLQAALRAAGAVAFPRHSSEGRQQIQTTRRLEDAMSSLGRVGRSSRAADDASDLDLDLDVGA